MLSTGQRRRIGDITVVSVPGRSLVRVGLIASKRIGNAVQRNRAKRRLRQAVIKAELPAGDYVILTGPATGTAPFTELVAWIVQGGSRGGQ